MNSRLYRARYRATRSLAYPILGAALVLALIPLIGFLAGGGL